MVGILSPMNTRREPDLGMLANRLLARLLKLEEPILTAHDLEMWEYVVLDRLAEHPTESQGELSRRTGRDPTRLIGTLDSLGAAGLITREPSPADRRQHLVALTPAGVRLHEQVKTEIRAMEGELLTAVPASRRHSLRRDLAALLMAPDPT